MGAVYGVDGSNIARAVDNTVVTSIIGSNTYNTVTSQASATGNNCGSLNYNNDFGVFKVSYPAINLFNTITFASAQRNTPWTEGVLTSDLIVMNKHRVAKPLMTNPFSIIACDVYKDKILKFADFSDPTFMGYPSATQYTYDNWLVSRIILGIITDPNSSQIPQPTNVLPGASSWYFIPEDIFVASSTFGNQFGANPLNVSGVPGRTSPVDYALPFKSTVPLGITNYTFNVGSACFPSNLIAYKMGDANRSALVPYPISKVEKDGQSINLFSTLESNKKSFQKGTVVEVHFKVNDFSNILSCQFGVKFDESKLKSLGISKSGKFTDDINIGTKQSNLGQIKTSWYDFKGALGNWDDGTHLFSMKFKVIEDIDDIEQLFSISESVLKYEVLDKNEDGVRIDIKLSAQEITDNNPKIFVSPNPVVTQTQLAFNSEKEEETELKVFNSAGVAVLINKVEVLKGQNRLDVDMSNLPSGIYLCKIGTNMSPVRIIKK